MRSDKIVENENSQLISHSFKMRWHKLTFWMHRHTHNEILSNYAFSTPKHKFVKYIFVYTRENPPPKNSSRKINRFYSLTVSPWVNHFVKVSYFTLALIHKNNFSQTHTTIVQYHLFIITFGPFCTFFPRQQNFFLRLFEKFFFFFFHFSVYQKQYIYFLSTCICVSFVFHAHMTLFNGENKPIRLHRSFFFAECSQEKRNFHLFFHNKYCRECEAKWDLINFQANRRKCHVICAHKHTHIHGWWFLLLSTHKKTSNSIT